MKTIEIIIRPDGESTVRTSGFQGAKACRDATKRIESDLGLVTSERLTPEALAAPVNTHRVSQ